MYSKSRLCKKRMLTGLVLAVSLMATACGDVKETGTQQKSVQENETQKPQEDASAKYVGVYEIPGEMPF